MTTLSSMFNSALGFAENAQSVKDRLPGPISAICEDLNASIGDRLTFKTSDGKREIVELGPVGISPNITKVRCTATNDEFIMKRIEMSMQCDSSHGAGRGNPGLVSMEALEALAQRSDLIASLPQIPNLVKCHGVQADNHGKVPAKVVLMELCGESLKDIMGQEGMKSDDLLHVFRDVAEGLLCLHTADLGAVVHGSLEPEHIFRDLKSGVWKLGSYGAVTRSSETASDIWQLGVLLLTVLFGSTAFSICKGTSVDEVRDLIVSSLPFGRPCSNMEGRLLVMIHWMLAAEPSQRPTAEQVVIALGKLGELPAPALALALPAQTREGFRALCMSLVRRTICDAIDSIDGSDRDNLINKYGEEALRNPALLPTSVKQDALSTVHAFHIRTIQSFLPGEVNDDNKSTDLKKLRKALRRVAAEAMEESSEDEELQVRVSLDVAHVAGASKTQTSSQTPLAQEAVSCWMTLPRPGELQKPAPEETSKTSWPPPLPSIVLEKDPLPLAQQASSGLKDLTPPSKPQESMKSFTAERGLELLDNKGTSPSSQASVSKFAALEELGDLFSSPAPQSSPTPKPMSQPVVQPSLTPQPMVQPVTQPGTPPIPTTQSMTPMMPGLVATPKQDPLGTIPTRPNPFDLPSLEQMQKQFGIGSVPSSVPTTHAAPLMAPKNVPAMHPASQSGQTPVFQQANASAGYATGMTQVTKPTKTDVSDPLDPKNVEAFQTSTEETQDPFAGFNPLGPALLRRS